MKSIEHYVLPLLAAFSVPGISLWAVWEWIVITAAQFGWWVYAALTFLVTTSVAGTMSIVGHLLRRRKRKIKPSSLKFYESRDSLDKERSWDDLLKSATRIDAMFIVGDKPFRNNNDISKFKRILFPDPNSEAMQNYGKINGFESIAHTVRNTSKAAAARGLRVKWMPAPEGTSLLVIDRDETGARVQVEYAISGMDRNRRPSVEIWKKDNPVAFAAFVEAFDKMWEASVYPY